MESLAGNTAMPRPLSTAANSVYLMPANALSVK